MFSDLCIAHNSSVTSQTSAASSIWQRRGDLYTNPGPTRLSGGGWERGDGGWPCGGYSRGARTSIDSGVGARDAVACNDWDLIAVTQDTLLVLRPYDFKCVLAMSCRAVGKTYMHAHVPTCTHVHAYMDTHTHPRGDAYTLHVYICMQTYHVCTCTQA